MSAELTHVIEVLSRCGADGAHAVQFQQFQKRRSHTAVGAADQREFPRLHLPVAINHLIRGDIIENEGDCLAVVDTVRDGKEMVRFACEILGPRVMHRERARPLALLETDDACAKRIDFAEDFVPRNKGERWAIRII